MILNLINDFYFFLTDFVIDKIDYTRPTDEDMSVVNYAGKQHDVSGTLNPHWGSRSPNMIHDTGHNDYNQTLD